MSTIKGIDVSTFQTVYNWNQVKNSGISFAILRAGYGRYEEDETFAPNAKGATAVGIPIGAYWFSYALDVESARQEARKCLEVIKNYNITLPIYFDFEYDTVRYAKDHGVTLGKQAFNDHAVAFCEVIEAAGYRAGVYYNLDYLSRLVDMSRIGKYSLWFAQYNSYPQASKYDVWQYSSSGSVPGISGRVDMNEADESFLRSSAPVTYEEGWQKSNGKWWYRYTDGSYPKNEWKKINDIWYYFDEEGYMVSDSWVTSNGKSYYVGSDGAMVTNKTLKIDNSGAVVPAGEYYHQLKDVTYSLYHDTLEKLIAKGVIKGKSGEGEDLVLDLTEDAVRILVVLYRAGVFKE